MNGVLFTIPDGTNGDTLSGWLDWHLVAPGLDQLVAELSAVHGPPRTRTTLDSLLAGHRDRVLAGGVGELPGELVSRLLRQPELLLELRDLVFAEGGAYWDRIDPEEFPQERAEAVIDAVRAGIGREKTAPRATAKPAFYLRPMVVSFATAAAVLLAVYLIDWRNPRTQVEHPTEVAKAGIKWGWASDGGLPTAGDDATAFKHLRDKAKQWFDETPETSQALAKRVGEFRIGCAALQTADGLPLSKPEKDELLKRCVKWAADFDKLLVRAENREDVAAVRKDADDLVNRLSKYLGDREQATRKA